MMNKEIINQLKSTKTVDELKDLAAKNGYTLADEEASRYFELFHAKGKVVDDELNNVVGGACSLSRNGRFYSGDGKHNLIVTAFNHCDDFSDDRQDSSKGKFCPNCKNYYTHNTIMYCKVRTFNNDKYNPAQM